MKWVKTSLLLGLGAAAYLNRAQIIAQVATKIKKADTILQEVTNLAGKAQMTAQKWRDFSSEASHASEILTDLDHEINRYFQEIEPNLTRLNEMQKKD